MPMPLPTSEVFAFGDRIRRRRLAVIAGAGASVILAAPVGGHRDQRGRTRNWAHLLAECPRRGTRRRAGCRQTADE